jgi:hypothetical protein
MKKVSLFHIGPQKSATTWVYRALKEHPEIQCSLKDSVYYFDMYYHRGANWYHQHFNKPNAEKKLFDPTPSYIRSPWAPERIYNYNPDAKIICCLRDPIERAFSHYWHEKKKKKYRFDFQEVFSNYDLYSSWLEPGFYGKHIKKYLKFFPRDQILCLLFDDLKEDPKRFLQQIYDFIDIKNEFNLSVIGKKANEAGVRQDLIIKSIKKIKAKSLVDALGKKEYQKGIPIETQQRLYKIVKPEIEETENLLNIDLNHWKEKYENLL